MSPQELADVRKRHRLVAREIETFLVDAHNLSVAKVDDRRAGVASQSRAVVQEAVSGAVRHDLARRNAFDTVGMVEQQVRVLWRLVVRAGISDGGDVISRTALAVTQHE